jgi:hypothetical protein
MVWRARRPRPGGGAVRGLNPAPAAADLGGGGVHQRPASSPRAGFRCVCVCVCVPVCICVYVCACVRVAEVACGSGGGQAVAAAVRRWGPRWPCTFFVFKNCSRREHLSPLGAHPLRVCPVALGEGAFAGWAPPSGDRRELPLGEGSAVRKQSFAERIPALGEGSGSGSVRNCLSSLMCLCWSD